MTLGVLNGRQALEAVMSMLAALYNEGSAKEHEDFMLLTAAAAKERRTYLRRIKSVNKTSYAYSKSNNESTLCVEKTRVISPRRRGSGIRTSAFES